MTNLLDAARQALDTLTHIVRMHHLSVVGQAMAESAEGTLRTAIAEAEKTHCRYPECVENEREECQQCYQQALEAHTWSKAAENYAADAERFRWLAERDALARDAARWRAFLLTRPADHHDTINAAIDAAMGAGNE